VSYPCVTRCTIRHLCSPAMYGEDNVPDFAESGTHVEVRVYVTRFEDNLPFHPGKVIYFFRGVHCVTFKDSNGLDRTVDVTTANAYRNLRPESPVVRDARVAELMACNALVHARNLVIQNSLHSFIYVGTRVICRQCVACEYALWTTKCKDCKYVTGTVEKFLGKYIMLDLDVITDGTNNYMFRTRNVAACLLPLYGA